MRILVNTLFTVPGSQSGAVQTVTGALLFHLAQAIHEFGGTLFLLVSRTNAAYWRKVCPNVNFVMFPSQTHNRFIRIAIEQVACNWAIRKVCADVFYSSSGSLPYISLSCKTVVYLQNIQFFHHNEFYSPETLRTSWPNWLLKYWAQDCYNRWTCINSLKRATEVIAVSKTMAFEAKKYTKINRQRPVHIIPYGLNGVFNPNRNVARQTPEPYIISVSSLLPHKNYEACVRIFARLKHCYQVKHNLILIGSGPTRYVQSLKDLATELHIGGSVKFMGHVPHENLPNWYVHADAFVLTSACESFGLPIIEAMASGTPVLVSNLSGLPETVGNAALIEDPGKIEDFAEKLHSVLTNESLRLSLRQEGLERAKGFSWEKTAHSTIRVMRQAYSSH